MPDQQMSPELANTIARLNAFMAQYVEEAESWHVLRKDAKARALRLYRAYVAGDATPWK
jgi:hypothetical protein